VKALAILLALAGAARAEPSDRALVGIGLGLAIPDYLLGVTIHESSHALAAELVGATVDTLHVFPPGTDPSVNKFRFGWTYVHGLRSRGDQIFFYIAPKLTDALLLGGFAALVYTGAWPANRYGDVALTVFATGLWVDFSKDVVLFARTNDVVKVFDLWCLTGWRQVPARLTYLALVVGFGIIVEHAYQRTFEHDPVPMVAPLVTAVF